MNTPPFARTRSAARPAVILVAIAVAAAATLGGCSRETPQSLVASAKASSERKDHKAAVVQLKAALQQDPQNADTRLLLGLELLKAADPAGAVIELSKLRDQKVPDEKVMPPLARAMLLLGDERRLTTLYGDVELKEPKAQAALKASVASAFAALGDRERTEVALKAALKADPDNTVANVLQARIVAGGGDFTQGMKLAQAVVKRDPAAYDAWHLIGELALYGKGDVAAAVAAFRKSLAIEPANVQAHLALMSIAIRDRDIAAARAQAEELRRVLPRHPQMVFVDAQLAFHDRDLPKARELMQSLLKLAPNHVGVLQLAGAIEGELKSLVLAETHFAKALQVDPTLVVARRSLAMIYLRQGQPRRAFEIVAPLLGAESKDPAAHALAAEAALTMGDPAAAERLFVAAARLEPENERFKTALALIGLAQGQAERAFVDLETLARQSSSNYADLALISARLKRGEFDAALKAIDVLEKRPDTDRAMALNLRGRAHVLRGDNASARAAFEQALAAAPGDFASVSNLAAVDVREGLLDAAVARFDAAITADTRNTLAYVGKAEVLIRQRAPFEQVQDVLAAAIKAAPLDPEPRLQLVEYALKQRRLKEALVVAQSAAAALPDRPAVLDVLGRAQAQSGDRLQALSTFQRAANLDATNAVPHMRIADLHKADGKKAAAIAALRRALEIDPRLAEARASLVDMLVADNQIDQALLVAREMQRDAGRIDGFMLEAGIHARARSTDRELDILRAGLAKHPGSSDIAVRLHQVLRNAGREADARRFADEWIRRQPQDPAFAFELSTAAIERGDLPRAEALLRELVKRFPNHPLALNNLAFVLVHSGKPGAVAMAERALAARPGTAAIMDTLAQALAAEGQAAKGLQVQRDAVAKAPDDDGLRINLARIAVKAGDKGLARSELERLVAKGPLGPWHGEATRMLKTL